MKDAEQIYALYVQANPVPNPDLLPVTRDDAVLLSIEGSEDMQTQEPIKEQPAVRNTSRNVLVAAGAFAVVIVIGLVAALWIGTGDGEFGPITFDNITGMTFHPLTGEIWAVHQRFGLTDVMVRLRARILTPNGEQR